MEERMTRRSVLKRLAALGGAASLAAHVPQAVAAASTSQIGAAPAASALAAQDASVVRYLYNATPGPNERVYNMMIELFQSQNPGVTVEKIRVPGEIEIVQTMLSMLAAGDPPEIFLNRQRTATPFIARGVLTDLVPLAEADGLDLDDFWPSAIQTYGREGALYGLPFGASSNAFYYNVDLYNAAGVTLPTELGEGTPWNWDTLQEQAIANTSGEGPGKIFGLDAIFELDHVDMWIWQNGGQLWDLEAGESYFNEPEAIGAMQFLVDLATVHGAMPTPELVASAGEQFPAGRVALIAAGRYLLQDIEESTFEVGMLAAPEGPVTNTTRGDDLAHSLPSGAPGQDAAWEFAKLWTSDEGQQIVLTTRRSYTARRSFASSDWMQENLLPWEKLEVYIEGLERTGVYQAPDRANEVEAIFDRELGLAYVGAKTVEEAANVMKQDIDLVLQRPL
jgi:ABC-type glycerol-3-phosphate transport system substrate-binding protein